MRSFADPCLAVIFPVNRVADIVAFVFDPPMVSRVPVSVGSGHFIRLPTGEDQGVLLADPVAGYFEYFATDEDDLAGVREVDAFRAGNPAGPFLNPSPAAFLHDIIRRFAEQREDCLEYRSLQSGLVSLCGYKVVQPGFSANGRSRLLLSV